MEIESYDILCPYCQTICGDRDSFEGCSPFDDTRLDFECDECGKKFECEQCATVDYRTEKDCRLNGEECVAGKYHCKNCDSYDVNVELRLKDDALIGEKNEN